MVIKKAIKAIISLSGREVLVTENDIFQTFELHKEVGDTFSLPTILCFDENEKMVNGSVEILVKKNFLGRKVISVKKKRRTRTFRTRGSRPHLTTVEIKKISVNNQGGK